MKLINKRKAASLLGLSADTMRVYSLKYGVGFKVGREWLYTDEDIEILRNRNKQVGRPTATA